MAGILWTFRVGSKQCQGFFGRDGAEYSSEPQALCLQTADPLFAIAAMKLEQVPALLLAWLTIGPNPHPTGLALVGGGFTLAYTGFGFPFNHLPIRSPPTPTP